MTRAALLLACVAATASVACSSGGATRRGLDGATDAPSTDATATDATATDGATDANAIDDAANDADAQEVAAPSLFGDIAVDLVTDQFTGFAAQFFDAESVPTIPVDVSQTTDGCQLLVPRTISCAAGCGANSVCVGMDLCARQPAPVDVGTLHVEGLGATPLDLEPTSQTILSYPVVPTLPYPACAEGGDVTARATAFAVAGKCVGALEVTSPAPIPVTTGQATHLAWRVPGHAGISRIQVVLEISHHGGYAGELDCDVPDTGAFDLPAPLVTALVARGRAGYPTIKLARVSTTAAAAEPGVRLTVSSRAELPVDTGVISCGADGSPPCPLGTACATNYTCR